MQTGDQESGAEEHLEGADPLQERERGVSDDGRAAGREVLADEAANREAELAEGRGRDELRQHGRLQSDRSESEL